MKAAALAARSSTWWRDSSADDLSGHPPAKVSGGRARASESSSTSFNWYSPQVDWPARAPRGAGSAQVFAFPRLRAPHGEAGGGGSLGVGSNLLQGVNVLIVEDDFIVAFDMQALLEEQGARVAGPAIDFDEARALIAAEGARLQVAVLDVNINGQYVFPLAAELQQAGIPFVFATAYADDDRLFPQELRDVPRLAKPVLPNVLIGHLKRLLA
jgi:two-component system, response regulator PdtaR